MAASAHPGSPRLAWEELPAHVRAAVEAAIGSHVVAAETKHGGFSPGVAAVVELADGSRAFVKSAGLPLNTDSPSMHRREARVMAQLPDGVPVPRLRAVVDAGEWVSLVFDAIDGRMPELPWQADDLDRVLVAMSDLALCEAADLKAFDVLHRALFDGWRSLRADVPPGLDDWSRAHLHALAAREPEWHAASLGDALVHSDVRADNLLLTDDAVVFVDWAHASHGAPWLDLLIMAPALAIAGGPAPADLWAMHPLAHAADPHAVDAMVVATAGYFTHRATLGPIPGLPTIRQFQAEQGVVARRWAAERLRLT